MTDAPGTEVYQVSVRQKVGDVVVLVLLAPIFCAVVGLLLAIPAAVLIYGLELGASDAQRARLLVGAAAAGAVPLSLLALRFKLCWSITLYDDRLRLGSRLLGREVPYEQVRFVRAGQNAMAREYRRDGAPVPVQIELASRPRRCRIWLPEAEARQALQAIHLRSDAAALDVDGRELLPKDPQRRAAGVQRLVRLHRVAAVTLIPLGVLLFGIVIVHVFYEGFEDVADMIEVVIGGLTALTAGLAAARRARRVGRRPKRAPRKSV